MCTPGSGHIPRGNADADESGERPCLQQKEASHWQRLCHHRLQRRWQRTELQAGMISQDFKAAHSHSRLS